MNIFKRHRSAHQPEVRGDRSRDVRSKAMDPLRDPMTTILMRTMR